MCSPPVVIVEAVTTTSADDKAERLAEIEERAAERVNETPDD